MQSSISTALGTEVADIDGSWVKFCEDDEEDATVPASATTTIPDCGAGHATTFFTLFESTEVYLLTMLVVIFQAADNQSIENIIQAGHLPNGLVDIMKTTVCAIRYSNSHSNSSFSANFPSSWPSSSIPPASNCPSH